MQARAQSRAQTAYLVQAVVGLALLHDHLVDVFAEEGVGCVPLIAAVHVALPVYGSGGDHGAAQGGRCHHALAVTAGDG